MTTTDYTPQLGEFAETQPAGECPSCGFQNARNLYDTATRSDVGPLIHVATYCPRCMFITAPDGDEDTARARVDQWLVRAAVDSRNLSAPQIAAAQHNREEGAVVECTIPNHQHEGTHHHGVDSGPGGSPAKVTCTHTDACTACQVGATRYAHTSALANLWWGRITPDRRAEVWRQCRAE